MSLRLLNTQEVAEMTGISPNTLRVWRCKGIHTFPYVKIRNLVRYPEENILIFIQENLHSEDNNNVR